MSLTRVNNNFYYQALSTDIVGGSISGASAIGAPVYITDTQVWYQILPDFTLTPLILNTSGSSGGGGGGAVTIASGADVTEGGLTDSAISGSGSGSISGKLRNLNTVLTDVYDSTNHWLKTNASSGGSMALLSGSNTIGNVGLTGGSVGIVGSPSVTGNVGITSGSVGIVGTPNVGISSGSVGIIGTPNVGISSGSVGIVGIPNVNIASGSTALVATENLIGKVGQPYTTVSVTPTITAGSYAANAGVGGKMTLTNALRAASTGGTWQSLLVTDKNNAKAQFNVLMFNYDPTSGSYTDRSAIILGSDLSKVIRNVTVSTADYQTVSGSIAVADINVMQTVMAGSSNGTLYATVMTTGTPTYASTSDLTFQFGFQQG
jgi:hypothetical protein